MRRVVYPGPDAEGVEMPRGFDRTLWFPTGQPVEVDDELAADLYAQGWADPDAKKTTKQKEA
ncbi:MAG: hypothetical protein ACRD2W_18390 [Acidimicrobiales bacterium]